MHQDSIQSIWNIQTPVWRTEDGRIIAIRSLSDDRLLEIAKYLLENAPDYLSALVDDAILRGASEDDARFLLDLDADDILIRTEPVWGNILAEIYARNLDRPVLNPIKEHRHLAELSDLLIYISPYATFDVPAPLAHILRKRANIVQNGQPLLPKSWIDFQRSVGGIKMGALEIFGVFHEAWDDDGYRIIPDLVVFGRSGKNLIHAMGYDGRCFILPYDFYLEGRIGRSIYTTTDFISYLQNILSKAWNALNNTPVKRSKSSIETHRP